MYKLFTFIVLLVLVAHINAEAGDEALIVRLEQPLSLDGNSPFSPGHIPGEQRTSLIISGTPTRIHRQQFGYYSAQYQQLVQLKNRNKIAEHNSNANRKFTLQPYAKFIRKSEDEIKAQYLMKAAHYRSQVQKVLIRSQAPSSKPLLSSLFKHRNVNWTEMGKVSSVKNQGMCGSCYAFTAISDIESSYLFKGVELDLSEQQLVDCSQRFGNQGCGGGWMTNCFSYAMIKGVTGEQSYPYSPSSFEDGLAGDCRSPKGKYRIRSHSYTSYRTYDCQSLANMVEKRPVTAAVAVDFYFFFYAEGILTQCGTDLNHGVLVTGVIENESQNYWIIKNSWSTEWGELGYGKIDRSIKYGNLCEICYAPSYSIV